MRRMWFSLLLCLAASSASAQYQTGPGVVAVPAQPQTIRTGSIPRDARGADGPILPSDDQGTVVVDSHTYLVQDAATQSSPLWGACVVNLGTTFAMVKAPSSKFLGASGAAGMAIPHNAWACFQVFGGDYLVYAK